MDSTCSRTELALGSSGVPPAAAARSCAATAGRSLQQAHRPRASSGIQAENQAWHSRVGLQTEMHVQGKAATDSSLGKGACCPQDAATPV